MKRFEIYVLETARGQNFLTRHTGMDDFESAVIIADELSARGGLFIDVFDTTRPPKHVSAYDRDGNFDATLCELVYRI